MIKRIYFRCFIVFSVIIYTFEGVSAQGFEYNRMSEIDNILKKDSIDFSLTNSWAGYRIQVFSGSNRNEAMLEKTKVSKQFPELKCYLVYVQPFFKIRVGDYISKQEVYNDYSDIKTFYPYSLIINDQINYK